jgi:hypothetical protein
MTLSTTMPDIATYSSQPPHLTDTVMIHASTAEKYSYPEHATPYLLVSNFVNRGNYLLNRRQVEISASHFYFLNPNDTLEIRFPTAAPLQTCMILFEEKFIGSCLHYLYTADEELLDSPDGQPTISPMVSKYDSVRFLIQYLVYSSNRIWTITITCSPVSDHTSSAAITYSFTGLNEMGNQINQHFLQIIYRHNLSDWADDINHYLAAPLR